MPKIKVTLQDTVPKRTVVLDTDATKGATFGKDIYAPNGELVDLADLLNSPVSDDDFPFVYWRQLQEVPPNVVALAETETTGLYVVTGAGTSATRQIQPTIGRTTVSNGDGVAGDPVVDLAVVVDSGVGAALVKITRDAYGRVEGTEAATTDDLPEGTSNLYFTDARADARISLQKGQPLGLGTLDADGKLDTGQLPALAITKTFVVASQAAMLALTVEEGDVAVRTDLNMSFILTAAPASTLSNWQELLTPMSPVTSVFGRVGSVVAASGDYTFAQIGSKPTTLVGYGISDAQPLDATLTALAAANWAANAIPVGSGADTVSQISFAANTFPARSSAGNLVAKPITDFGLSLVDDANAVAAVATLGLPANISNGTYTPTATPVANATSATPFLCTWMRIGNAVLVSGRIDAVVTVGGTFTKVRFSLPVASNFSGGGDASGSGSWNQSIAALGAAFINADSVNDELVLSLLPPAATNTGIRFTVTYPILP